MIKEKIIFSVLANLGLLEGEKNDATIQKAAQKALNDDKFELQTYKGVALRSILGTLNKKDIAKYLKPQKASLDKSFFELSDSKGDTSKQVVNLKEALRNAEESDDALLWVLERFATTLAVSEKHDTVSLFDFVKLTAAFAYCLLESENVRMVSANISGIQSYLYEIVSKNAAKLLKGRSFYLQLLGDSVLNQFLHQFNVKSYCVIYASGGGFYVLVPDYQNIKNQFDTITKEVAEKVFNVHKTSLFVETAISEPFDGCEGLNKTWDDLFTMLKKRRNNRLSWNKALRDNFFGFVEDGGDIERDPITNEEIKKGEKTAKLADGTKVLPITKEQIELGKDLRDAKYWYATTIRSGSDRTITDLFGTNHYFQVKKANFADAKLLTFNDFDSETPTFVYGGNGIPTFKREDAELMENANKKLKEGEDKYRINDVKPFDILAQGKNLDRLAILRMDVDGLGKIFSDGFDNLCKYATLSRSLDIFFKGYLNTLWKNYENTTQIIYSGGDDLFVVGKWNDIFAFAREIQKAFKIWSCDALTLSGGLVLLPAKFPVMQGAKLAERAEKAAKKHEFNGHKKNAICFLDMPLNWEEELPTVKKLFVDVLNLLSKKEISMNFLTKISMYAEARVHFLAQMKKYEKDKKERRPNPSWTWTMLYDLSRYKDQQAKGNEAKKFVGDIMAAILSNTFEGKRYNEERHFLDIINIACRWAELEKRTEKEDNI